MPTYEYECKICGHNFEVFQSMSDAPLSECPQCGKELRRLINGGSGVIFKGSGFYVNDKNKESSKPKKEGKFGSKESSASGGAKTPCASCPASGESCPAKASESSPQVKAAG